MEQETLRKLQLTELAILDEVVTVCNKYHIQYFLVGGTLLGAVRHGGFIPWDDDLDIAMPRNDYNRFIKLCINGALGEDYYLHDTTTDPEYWLPFAKVKKKRTLFDEIEYKNINTMKGIFIDIFPLDYSKKNSGIIYTLRAKTVKTLSSTIYSRRLNIPQKTLKSYILFLITRPFSISRLSRMRDKLASLQKNGDYIINLGSNYPYTKQTMKKNIYFQASTVSFEGNSYNAPCDYYKYLEKLFGNWKKLPDESKRRNHNPATVLFELK